MESKVVKLRASQLENYLRSVLPKVLNADNADDYAIDLSGNNYTYEVSLAGIGLDGALYINLRFYPAIPNADNA